MMNEGNASGIGIACVDEEGKCMQIQFWRHYSFGNVQERPFSEMWMDTSNELMDKLKRKKEFVKGRCARCKWLNICGGNFRRVRAEAKTGDVWARRPAVLFDGREISIPQRA